MEKSVIQGLVAKKLIDLVIRAIEKKIDLGGIQKYVKEPNDLDIMFKQQQKTVSKQGKYIEELEKDVAILKKDSHPKKEFKCNCKCQK